MARSHLQALTVLTSGLLLAACGDEKDSPSTTTEVGALTPGSSAATTLDKALIALGGREAVQELGGFRYEAAGQRYVLAEGFSPDDVIFSNSYQATVTVDRSGERLRVETERQIDFIGITANNSYVEIVDGSAGFVQGDEGLAPGFAAADSAMSPARVAAVKKHQLLLNPHVLLGKVARGEATAEDGGVALVDGQLQQVLEIEGIQFYVSAATGRVTKVSALEDVSPFKDAAVEALFDDWRPGTDTRVLFPMVATLAVAGELVLAENRSTTAALGEPDASLFALPAPGAEPSAAELERGSDSHAALSLPQSLGIPFRDTLQTAVSATELSPGVWHVTGGSHHSMVVEQTAGFVLVEAPLDGFRTMAVLAWAQEQLPGKPLTHVVSTHHHEDHVGGVRQAVGLGARLVAHGAAASYWQRVLNAPATVQADALAGRSARSTVELVQAGRTLTLADATNPVTVYEVGNNCHAEDMLVIGVGTLVFVSDLVSPGGGTPICPFSETLGNMQAYGFTPEMVVGGHGGTATVAELQALDAGG